MIRCDKIGQCMLYAAAPQHFQHAPSVRAAYTHTCSKPVMLLVAEALGEDICDLSVGRDVFEVDLLFFNLLAQEVVMDVDMFGAIIEFGFLAIVMAD
jgi:hypothetical protein